MSFCLDHFLCHPSHHSEEDRLDIGRALIDLQVEVNRTKEEAEAEALRSGQRIAELSSHCDKLQHELERAGQTQNHLRKKAVEMAQKKEQLDAEYHNLRAQHRGAAQDHAGVGAWRADLVRRLRALVKTTLAVMQERDEYASQLVSQTGLGGSRNAGASELRQVEQEGRALEAKITESPDAVGGGGSGSGNGGGGGRGGGYSSSVDGERLRNELSQELTRTRAQLEALQRENSRQTTSNAAFVQEHRRRLEEVGVVRDNANANSKCTQPPFCHPFSPFTCSWHLYSDSI
jgi:DNA repair exonuclease SbcCD ATPase subunit